MQSIINNKLKCYINCGIKNEEHISNGNTMDLVLDKKYIQIKMECLNIHIINQMEHERITKRDIIYN